MMIVYVVIRSGAFGSSKFQSVHSTLESAKHELLMTLTEKVPSLGDADYYWQKAQRDYKPVHFLWFFATPEQEKTFGMIVRTDVIGATP